MGARVVADIEGARCERRFNVTEASGPEAAAPQHARRAALARGRPRACGSSSIGTICLDERQLVVEVRAPDAPGVLHRITAAIAGLDLDIVSARVATLGNAVVDTFYASRAGAPSCAACPADAQNGLAGVGAAKMRSWAIPALLQPKS